jgi:hypothetical protein
MPPRLKDQPPVERTFWEVFPKRSVRRVLMLLAVLAAVLVLRRSGGLALTRLVDGLVPPVPTRASAAGQAAARPAGATPAAPAFQPLRVVPAPPAAGSGAGGAHP